MSRSRPLLPRIGNQPPPSDQKLCRKRRGPACEPCRAKRVACDGVRPNCTPCNTRCKACHYATQDNSETRLQALQREQKALSDLLEHLRTVPAVTAQAILYELRKPSSPLSVLRRYEQGQILKNPSESTAILSTLPQIHSEAELRLMVRHPVAYPALSLSHDSIMSKRTLVDSPDVFPTEQAIPGISASSSAGSHEMPTESKAQGDSELQGSRQDEAPGSSAAKCFDALVNHLHIGYWTSVAVTDRFAAGAIALYLETDHPMLRLFDAETFLNDLIHLRDDCCSAFLVNGLLAFASQAYTKTDSTAAVKSLEFEKEARILWRANANDSVPNLAGLVFLYIAMANNKNGNQGAANYIFEAGEMAKRMKMFGAHDRLTALQPHLLTEEAQYSFKQATWGMFNLYHLCVHHWIAQPSEYPPALPIPEKPDGVSFDVVHHKFVRSQGTVTPDDEAYMYLCKLCSIDSEALIVLRDPTITRPPPLAFAFSRYKKLLDLIDSLPEGIRRVGKASAAVLFFHMYFHRCVMDLFRPYIIRGETQQSKFRHPEFDTPKAISRASTQQLKGLLVEYTAFQHFASGLMWHPTLLYIANGVLEPPCSPDWRFFFLLCIHCYSAMYDVYPFAETAIQSLLALAIDFQSISASEAANILKVTLHAKKESQRTTKAQCNADAANLHLAMSDRETEATATLSKRFQELSMFGQFAEDVLYGTKAQRGVVK